MASREIITLPNEVLTRRARPVTDFGAEFQTLVDDMIETMRLAPGVGLAAPQVAIPLRVAVVEYGEEEDDDEDAPKKLYTIVNPEITRPSEDTLIGLEGCLSIPGLVAEVERHAEVTVKALNRRGQPVKIKAQGWLARIFQHEIDHLNGVLMTDRAERVFTLEELQNQEEEAVDGEEL